MSFIIAKSEFERAVSEYLSDPAHELSQAMGPNGLARELRSYIRKYSGKRVRVRMQSGRLQPHRAFNTEEDPNGRLPIESPLPGDERLPVYSLADFRLLDGLSCDLREKADELGLPWDLAFSAIQQSLSKAPIKAPAAGAGKRLDNPDLFDMSQIRVMFGVSRSTVYRWAEAGKLQRVALARETGRRGKFLVTSESVAKLKREDSE